MPTVKVTKKKPQTKHPMFRNRRLNEKVRITTLQRDHFCCRSCLEPYSELKLECDHIIPLSKGGEDSIHNTQTLCIPCHRLKTNMENYQ